MRLHDSGALSLGSLHASSIAEELDPEEEDGGEDEGEDEEDINPDGTVRLVLCDKETNTENEFRNPRRRTTENVRGSAVRRSQTFSPAGRPGNDYICKVYNIPI